MVESGENENIGAKAITCINIYITKIQSERRLKQKGFVSIVGYFVDMVVDNIALYIIIFLSGAKIKLFSIRRYFC